MPLMNDPAICFKELFVHAGLSYSLSSFLSTIALVLIVKIVGHLLAIMDEFGLNVLQQPAGNSLLSLSEK